MDDASIEVLDVHKRYGPTVALDGMSFAVHAGMVTGFVGPNGAGKSTTMRVVLGLAAADSGVALVGGRRYRDLRRPLCQVGALLDANAFQPSRTGRNHLLWIARSQGLAVRRVDEVIDLVGLGQAGRRRAGGYSLGMRQRLGIAAVMLGDPPVLMMDEPFNGMDPEGIIWLRAFMRAMAGQGRAVLISSHLMGELEDVAHHVVVVGRGRVIANASVASLTAPNGLLRLRTRAAAPACRILSAAGARVSAAGPDVLVDGLPAQQVAALLNEYGVEFSELSAHRSTLEQAYLALTAAESEYRPGAVQ